MGGTGGGTGGERKRQDGVGEEEQENKEGKLGREREIEEESVVR